MHDVNWWLMALSFFFGLLLTVVFMIRRVTREVPIYAALGRGPKVDVKRPDVEVKPEVEVPKPESRCASRTWRCPSPTSRQPTARRRRPCGGVTKLAKVESRTPRFGAGHQECGGAAYRIPRQGRRGHDAVLHRR